jgi:hypothetical protein
VGPGFGGKFLFLFCYVTYASCWHFVSFTIISLDVGLWSSQLVVGVIFLLRSVIKMVFVDQEYLFDFFSGRGVGCFSMESLLSCMITFFMETKH